VLRNENTRKWLKFLLRILVSLAALTWVLNQVDLSEFKEAVASAQWEYLGVVWVFNALLFWARSFRFQLILRKLNCAVSVNTLFGSSAVMALYGMVMPGMLSLAAKWYVIKRATGKGAHVVSAMLYNQVSIMVIMVAFGLLALVISNPLEQLPIDSAQARWLPLGCVVLFLVIVVIFAGLLSRRAGKHIDKMADRLFRPLPLALRGKAHLVLSQLHVFRTVGVWFHVLIGCLTLITGAVGCGILYLLAAKAANVSVPIMVFVWLQAIVYVLGRIPISLANCGPREIMLVTTLGIYGIDKPHALLMSAIIFSAHIFLAFIGALYQLSWSFYKNR